MILLINLYDSHIHKHLRLSQLRAMWSDARRGITADTAATDALHTLLTTLHHRKYRHLRFQRKINRDRTQNGAVYTTATAATLMFDPDKSIVNLAAFRARHGHLREADLTEEQARCLAQGMARGEYTNGKPLGHTYELCWATRDATSTSLSGSALRDRLGLVDVRTDDALIQLSVKPDPDTPLSMNSPSALEAASHRRFRAQPHNARAPQVGYAVDLAPLRSHLRLDAGLDEVVMGAVPLDRVDGVRYAGLVQDDGDLCPKTHGDTDAKFAQILLAGRSWTTVLDELKLQLET